MRDFELVSVGLVGKDIDQFVEEHQEAIMKGEIVFAVRVVDIIRLEINNPTEFFDREFGEYIHGFLAAYEEDDRVVLQSLYGQGEEDKIYCWVVSAIRY